jgi:protein-S-isoprenylcysteine O-methyltransferase Ste14
LGRYFFGLGLLAFFVLAAQIYGSQLFGRKFVNFGIYRYIRHPQYLSLGLSAFGLFTMWPRMIIFLLFVGMMFAYYFLARVEERRMLAIDPATWTTCGALACSSPATLAAVSTGAYLEICASRNSLGGSH